MSTALGETPIAEPDLGCAPSRAPRRPRFTREQIAATALAIADAEGFEAVSMRRVAAELGAGTMTLYHYVRTKDDLLALMDDAIMGEVLVPDGELPRHWRERCARSRALARRVRAPPVGASRRCRARAVGPNGMRHFEQSLAAVVGSTIAGRRSSSSCSRSSTTTCSATSCARPRIGRPAPVGGVAPPELMAYIESQLESGEPTRRSRRCSRRDEPRPSPGRASPSRRSIRSRFDRGLERLLDGIEARLGAATAPSSCRA